MTERKGDALICRKLQGVSLTMYAGYCNILRYVRGGQEPASDEGEYQKKEICP